MAGFPTRPSRLALGPTMENRFGVVDPTKELGEAVLNLLLWTVAGMAVTNTAGWAYLDWSGAALTVEASAEHWDPNGASEPSVVRNGVGDYTLTYAASYNDETGTAVTTNLTGAEAHAQAITNLNAVAQVQADKRTVEVRMFTADTGAAADSDVLVEVY